MVACVVPFKLGESLLTLLSPDEIVGSFKDLEEWQAFVNGSSNESIENCYPFCESLDILYLLEGTYIHDRSTFFLGLALIPCWFTMKPKNFPEDICCGLINSQVHE